MFADPTPARCAECGELLTHYDSASLCILCGHLFCRRHLTFRKGVANCGNCEEPRLILEKNGGVSDADEARVVELLLIDIENTVGSGQHAVAEEAAARIRLFTDDPCDFEQRVVDDVQQYLHDSYLDTTWPTCPEHRRHPLWYSDGWWTCDKAGKQIARLGQLTNSHGWR